MKFYHATPKRNLTSIVNEGLRPGFDGQVYLTKTIDDCVKFSFIRGDFTPVVIEVDLPESSVEESFDHSKGFFKCDCFVHEGRIDNTKITGAYQITSEGDFVCKGH